jgi:hypothetical protein
MNSRKLPRLITSRKGAAIHEIIAGTAVKGRPSHSSPVGLHCYCVVSAAPPRISEVQAAWIAWSAMLSIDICVVSHHDLLAVMPQTSVK